jgi:hypothetical protein
MTKHTPGPWEATEGSYGNYVAVRAGKKTVCRIPWGDGDGANARLIASAPDLLDALSFLVQAAETEPGMAIYRAHIEKGKAAIAKAEGRE